MPSRRLLALVLGALCLPACVNQQKEVALYQDVLTSHYPATTQPFAADQPLRLSEALTRANGTSEQLAMAGEDYVQALIAKDRAAATFLPRISLAPVYNRLEPFSHASFPSTFDAIFPTHYFDLPVNTRIDINAVQDIANVRSAGRTAEQRRALLLDLQETVLLNTCDAFYQVLIDDEQVRVLEHALDLRNQQVDSIERTFHAGMARQLDVLQSQADAAATQVQLTTARNQASTARSTLAFLVGVPTLPEKLVDDLTIPEKLATTAELTQQALANRADLAAAHKAIEAASQNVKSAIGQYFPSVGLNLSTFLYRESFPSDSWWSAMFTANLPIFEAGIIHANVRTAMSQLRQAGLAEHQLVRRIEEQVAIARTNFTSSTQRLSDLHRELTAAQSAYQQAQNSFNAGTATNLDRLSAQNQELQAALQVASETFSQKLAYLHLARMTGQLEQAVK